MTGYLLDTNAVLLALGEPASLSARARRAILAGPNILSTIADHREKLHTVAGSGR